MKKLHVRRGNRAKRAKNFRICKDHELDGRRGLKIFLMEKETGLHGGGGDKGLMRVGVPPISPMSANPVRVDTPPSHPRKIETFLKMLIF